MTHYATFRDITKDMNLIIQNNISEIDETVLWNFTENYYPEDDCECYPEIYQYFLTNLDKREVDRLVDRYNLIFTYSELLDNWVLCVGFWGMSWSQVEVEDKGGRVGNSIWYADGTIEKVTE